ncbi:MAG: hypothetical protein D6694_12200 [Gammaproteobacteria bacterium]|nr:MAG: hypothetical protein D6694_12200 [Gammaproteobacteria bacterium]
MIRSILHLGKVGASLARIVDEQGIVRSDENWCSIDSFQFVGHVCIGFRFDGDCRLIRVDQEECPRAVRLMGTPPPIGLSDSGKVDVLVKGYMYLNGRRGIQHPSVVPRIAGGFIQESLSVG